MHNGSVEGRGHITGFVDVSVSLTGFEPGELRATGLVEQHYATVVGRLGDDEYQRFAAGLLAAGGDPLPDGLLPVARAITHLWYLGVWPDADQAVSPRAYAESLVWKTFHGFAPGTWAPGFGSWSRPPAGTR